MMHWEWILGASGPHHRTTHLRNVLAGLGRLSLDQGGHAPGTRGLPSAFRRSRRSAASSPGCSYQIFGSQFEVIFLLHYSVTSVSDCFCFSMGATDSCYTCFYFWNLCYIFFLFQKFFCIQYGGGRLLFRELSSSWDGSSAESESLVKDTCSVQQGQSS